jgi:hypothetical protein
VAIAFLTPTLRDECVSCSIIMKILAHTSFIGTSGYANHARSFFCALNKLHTVKVRNFTVGNTWKGMNMTPHDNESYITPEMKDMLILQTLWNEDKSRSDYPMYGYKNDFVPDVNIILMENNHHYYYDEYKGYKIGFCVYESCVLVCGCVYRCSPLLLN